MIEVPEVPFSKTFFTKRTAHFNLYLTLQQKTSGKLIETCRVVTHTHPFNGPFSGTTRVVWYQKGKTNLDFTEARDNGRQWHQLGHIQVCTSLQTDNHTSTSTLSFLQAGCPSCHPTNSVKALKAIVEWSVKG